MFETSGRLLTPYQYFTQFFTPEMIYYIVEQTNWYSFQEQTRSINTDVGEMQKFLALLLYMRICQLPAIDDYWSVRLRYPLVADVMSSKRFQCIRRFIHFHDHFSKDNDDDKFEKVKPLFVMFREQCQKVEGSNYHSVDEVMVPY